MGKKSKFNLSDGEEDEFDALDFGSLPERDDFKDEMLSDEENYADESKIKLLLFIMMMLYILFFDNPNFLVTFFSFVKQCIVSLVNFYVSVTVGSGHSSCLFVFKASVYSKNFVFFFMYLPSSISLKLVFVNDACKHGNLV